MSEHTRAELTEIAERWVVEGWQRANIEGVLAMYSDDFVDLSHPSGKVSSREENAAALADLYVGFPDFFVTIDFLIVDEETARLAIRWTARGTHRGRFFGIEPTGNKVVLFGQIGGISRLPRGMGSTTNTGYIQLSCGHTTRTVVIPQAGEPKLQ